MRSRVFWLGLLAYVLLVCIYNPTSKVFAANQQEIDVQLTPQIINLPIDNMQPGDEVNNGWFIHNNGRLGLQYQMESELIGGSELLYKGLYITVRDADKVIYTGKLQDLKYIENRHLDVGKSDHLTYTVLFPAELGNEYQGLQATVQFVVYATEAATSTSGNNSSGATNTSSIVDKGLSVISKALPDTATGYSNFLVVGGVILIVGLFLLGKRKQA